MFGIILGVLIGVWTMYTMLSRSNQAQNAIAEVRMIQAAAQQYKSASATNNYSGIDWTNGLGALAPYLGQSPLTRGIGNSYRNIFGGEVFMYSISWEGDKDLQLIYGFVPNIDVCQKILNAFGEIESQAPYNREDTRTNLVIKPGKTNSGIVGGIGANETGCNHNSNARQDNVVTLSLIID